MVSHVHRLNDSDAAPEDRIGEAIEKLDKIADLLRLLTQMNDARLTERQRASLRPDGDGTDEAA